MQKQKIMKIKMWKYIKERVFVILLGVHQTDDWGEVQSEGERDLKVVSKYINRILSAQK